jgi:hypothetical protein
VGETVYLATAAMMAGRLHEASAITEQAYREALDCEAEWVCAARTNVRRAHQAFPGAVGEVSCGDATRLDGTLQGRTVGIPVDLVVTSPPYGPVVHGLPDTARVTGGKIVRRADRYATGTPHPSQLARGSSQRRMLNGLTAIFTGCHAALRPGGHMVITARPYTDKGTLVDFPAIVIAAAEAAGFDHTDRHAALLARWDGRLLHPHVTFFHLRNVRASIAAGKHALARAHEDVLVFGRSA